MPESDTPDTPLPAAETLQFRRAEHVDTAAAASTQRCVRCSRAIDGTYFHALGKVICPECAASLEAWQQAPKPHSLAKAFVYGLGAAIAGSALYAVVAIVTGFELALIAILIGYMVGKAVRYASGGLGGRPQQILAVLLTYFAISTSYIPVAIYHIAKDQPVSTESSAAPGPVTGGSATEETKSKPALSLGASIITLLGLAIAAPFLSLSSVGGLLSLLIIFFGLQRAWRMTGRVDIPVMGPYQAGA